VRATIGQAMFAQAGEGSVRGRLEGERRAMKRARQCKESHGYIDRDRARGRRPDARAGRAGAAVRARARRVGVRPVHCCGASRARGDDAREPDARAARGARSRAVQVPAVAAARVGCEGDGSAVFFGGITSCCWEGAIDAEGPRRSRTNDGGARRAPLRCAVTMSIECRPLLLLLLFGGANTVKCVAALPIACALSPTRVASRTRSSRVRAAQGT
jgi:hypothetical protein